MIGCTVHFQNMPVVGFAHHFYTEKEYCVEYGFQKSIEIVYIKSGEMVAQLEDMTFTIPENSFFLLFRHLPIRLYSAKGVPHAHCSLQLIVDYEFQLLEKPTDYQTTSNGLLLPFVTPVCQETGAMKKMLYGAVSDLGISRQEHSFCASLAGLSILQTLSKFYRKRMDMDRASQLQYQVKEYIAANLRGPITLSDIARTISKTPNYINHVFKEECGVSIHRYINEERVHRLADLIQAQAMSFPQACEYMGIEDVCYGYRLFKKHMGITPKEYLAGIRYLPGDSRDGEKASIRGLW